MRFSLIVPVYNRPEEVRGLLESLTGQTDRGFECIIVEDGSTLTCRQICEEFSSLIDLKYFYKENEGRSIARNYGMERADGDFFVFVDSDCLLPADYFRNLRKNLEENGAALDSSGQKTGNTASASRFFGGPDAADSSFSPLQKAINFAMTSFLTTGGIRGGKVKLEKFVPRTFNMGFSREVYEKVGGFREMFSEDIDMSTRVRNAGFTPELFRDVKVYHKRRVSLKKFWKQVHIFGMSRITLQLLYPGSLKAVHTLPAFFVIVSTALTICTIIGICLHSLLLILFGAPLVAYLLLLFITASISTGSLKTGILAVAASMIQLWGYGTGFIQAYVWKILLRHGRDEEEERKLRIG